MVISFFFKIYFRLDRQETDPAAVHKKTSGIEYPHY